MLFDATAERSASDTVIVTGVKTFLTDSLRRAAAEFCFFYRSRIYNSILPTDRMSEPMWWKPDSAGLLFLGSHVVSPPPPLLQDPALGQKNENCSAALIMGRLHGATGES